MENIKFAMTPGYLALPTGGAVSGAGVCPKHVQRLRVSAGMGAPLSATAWVRSARADFTITATTSASSGRVT